MGTIVRICPVHIKHQLRQYQIQILFDIFTCTQAYGNAYVYDMIVKLYSIKIGKHYRIGFKYLLVNFYWCSPCMKSFMDWVRLLQTNKMYCCKRTTNTIRSGLFFAKTFIQNLIDILRIYDNKIDENLPKHFFHLNRHFS